MSDDERRVSTWGVLALVLPLVGWACALVPIVAVVLSCAGLVPTGFEGMAAIVISAGYLGSLVISALGMYTSLGAAMRIQADTAHVRGRGMAFVGMVLSFGLGLPSVLSTLAVFGLLGMWISAGAPGPHGRPARGASRVRGLRLAGWVRGRPDLGAGRAWVRSALLEHEAVSAFERLGDELAGAGAPEELISGCRKAADQERAHTQACLALASRFLGAPLVLDDAPRLPVRNLSFEDLAIESFEDGCLGEGLAAAVAAEAASSVDDPEVAEVLARIAVEEAEHAELGAAVLTWCLERGGPSVALAVEHCKARERVAPWFPETPKHGGLPRARQQALFAAVCAA